ncbi:MAG: Crp/Fnr family transcriptional regulator [Burkholderiaceae bacterium]|nr:Crp/Fnr family transcriptional regulator [Burkholderiaceae bacterium]
MSSAPRHHDRRESREISRELARRLSERLGVSARPVQQAVAGATLLRAGDLVTRLPFVVQGRVDSVLHMHGGDGGRIIPVSWGDGEIVLLSHLFINRPSFVDLVAGASLSLRWASVAEIEQSLLDDNELLVLLVRFLAQRLREVQTRERGWVERGVHERVCATLARLAQQSIRDAAGHALIVATHEELAERSGVSRPKLSKELKRLETEGRLKLERKAIRIVDLKDLFDPAG